MENLEFEVSCPYCGQTFLVTSEPGIQVQCMCPHCMQNVIFEAPMSVDAQSESGVDPTESTSADYSIDDDALPTYPQDSHTTSPQNEHIPQNVYSSQDTYIQPTVDKPIYAEETKSHFMRYFIIGLTVLLLIVAGAAYWYFGIYTPQQQELADFNMAKAKNDVYAARDFLGKHPTDVLPEHKTAMEDIINAYVKDSTAWANTNAELSNNKTENCIQLLETYLNEYPKGLHRNEATSKLTEFRGQARMEEEARNKEVIIEMETNGTYMRRYYCNYGSHEESNGYGGTRYYEESSYISVPSGKVWRITNVEWYYGLSRMYYPTIVLDNGFTIKVQDAYSQNYTIPGGHTFKVKTPSMYSSDGSYYSYTLKISIHEDDI